MSTVGGPLHAKRDILGQERKMQFEERELTSYAEPISASALEEGKVYFTVQYVNKDLLVPIIETLVFVGRFLSPDGLDRLRFQDIESYLLGVRYDSVGSEKATFQSPTENGTKHIFEYERALDELMRCAIRRGKSSL
jgi:hypothetical protein